MVKKATILLSLVLVLTGCASTSTYPNSYSQVRSSCPANSVKVCEVGSLRGCRCGELIIL